MTRPARRLVFRFMRTWFYRRICCWLVRTLRLPTLSRRVRPFACRPGDWLLGSNPWKLQYWLVPGTWEHGAMVVAPGVVGEWTAKGYGEVTLEKWCGQYTRVLVLRPGYRDVWAALRRVKALRHMPYDEEFARGPEAIYCFEMLALADPEIRVDWSDLLGLGREYVNGDDLAASPDVAVVHRQ